MIEKVHQLRKKCYIICKTVPNDLQKFQQCVPCPPKNGVILPDVCQFTYLCTTTPKHNTRNIFSSPMCNLRAFLEEWCICMFPCMKMYIVFLNFLCFSPFYSLKEKQKIKSYDIKNCYLLSPIMKIEIMKPTQSKSK